MDAFSLTFNFVFEIGYLPLLGLSNPIQYLLLLKVFIFCRSFLKRKSFQRDYDLFSGEALSKLQVMDALVTARTWWPGLRSGCTLLSSQGLVLELLTFF